MDGNQIAAATDRLHQLYPQDNVSLWTKVSPSGGLFFTALAEDPADPSNSVYGWGDTPDKAVDDLRHIAGKRDPEERRQKKIAELKGKLAKLEVPAETAVAA